VKKKVIIFIELLIVVWVNNFAISAEPYVDIVIDQAGNGDYVTITEAMHSLPMYVYQRVIIYIKNGIYEEKIRLDRNYITLQGESRDSTIIRYSQRRNDWEKNKDWIGPGVINVYSDDIIIRNLTIENTQPEKDIHAFAIYGFGTRIILDNCNIVSKGGDTVALWNYKQGMYYHVNCTFQGAVDCLCPRGWCFVKNSRFFETRKTATLWHCGSYNQDQKLVVMDSDFDGVEGFELGRHHYEAQFYLINCHFSSRMADRPIYLVHYEQPNKNNPYYRGDRKYFYGCRKEGKDYDWYKDNLTEAAGNPNPEDITPAWTFGGKWNPECKCPLKITDYKVAGKSLIVTFNEIVTVRGELSFKNKSGKIFRVVMQRFNDINMLTFDSDTVIRKEDLTGELVLLSGDIIASAASVYERSIGSTFRILIPIVKVYQE